VQTRQALLDLLNHVNIRVAADIGRVIAILDGNADERAHTRAAVLDLLGRADVWTAEHIGRLMATLGGNAEELAQARAALRRHLPGLHEPLTASIAQLFSDWMPAARSIAGEIAELGPTAAEQEEIRSVLLELLPGGALRPMREMDGADLLARTITSFSPDAETLQRAAQLPIGPGPARVIAAATRHNVSWSEWTILLPEPGIRQSREMRL
jgi:hypothetical protein